ncbi:MAG: c-type cytochrome biogenesis protein CcmI [Arenicellaceae bacterium]|nr:c-type cytochrome biogenesis protein CcmI [Arenicellaceae bacterium]
MVIFIFLGCIMVLACLLALVLPLGRNNATTPVNSDAHNIEIAREKLADFELQKSARVISEAQFIKLSQDAKRVLLHESELHNAPALGHGNSLLISVVIAALVPILALSLYLTLGSLEGLQLDTTAPEQVTQSDQGIDSLLQDLEDKLANNPDDAEGWALLGRSYMSMQQFAQAHKAYSNLRRILGDQPTVLLQLADAEVMLNGGAFTENTKQYISVAYAAEPDNIQALWMAAMLDTQEGDLASAISKWEKLDTHLTGQPEQQGRIRNLLTQARTKLSESASPSLVPISAQTITAQVISSIEADLVSVTIEVSLSNQLPAPIQNDMLVYVYARAASGPPMPLAVKQLRVADLPRTVTLTENDAMIDGMTLARFPQIILGARVSITGEPTAQPGDIQSVTSELSLPLDSPVKLEIKDLVE